MGGGGSSRESGFQPILLGRVPDEGVRREISPVEGVARGRPRTRVAKRHGARVWRRTTRAPLRAPRSNASRTQELAAVRRTSGALSGNTVSHSPAAKPVALVGNGRPPSRPERPCEEEEGDWRGLGSHVPLRRAIRLRLSALPCEGVRPLNTAGPVPPASVGRATGLMSCDSSGYTRGTVSVPPRPRRELPGQNPEGWAATPPNHPALEGNGLPGRGFAAWRRSAGMSGA
jgi:hypothetical protein